MQKDLEVRDDGRDLGTPLSRPTAESEDHTVDDHPIKITVSHGSIEEADFAVMVGTFDDEGMSGIERFLDQQLGGVLSARFETGCYPGPLGTSIFVKNVVTRGRPSTPLSAYIIGLGRSVALTRAALSMAVCRAILERCLQLEFEPPIDDLNPDLPSGGANARCEVGVSATLLGARSAVDGLSIGDAVAGIVDGVHHANRQLNYYEQVVARAGRIVAHPVRVAELEFIERFGDRADQVALVVRRLREVMRPIDSSSRYQSEIVVRRKRGGLPPGASIIDGPLVNRRFSITSANPLQHLQEDGDATLTFDVSFLGSDARADRVTHQLDRVAIDALADRLAMEPTDITSAATLYDMLVPETMRHRLQAVPSVQLIVDETSANYPWELLSASRPDDRDQLSRPGSIIRQFAETTATRILVDRASRATALVIAAGQVPGLTPIPAVYAEANEVRQQLSMGFGRPVDYLTDETQPLSITELINALNGDHQIIHLACHGEFQPGDSVSTGALLNAQFRLRVETIRQLRRVPDLVFLNCCHLGRIGSTRRAAGLAREFIAIGVRAVIAAGWPVGDKPAKQFALELYGRLMRGMPLAEAIGEARNSLPARSETWAAYQCYGDPTFVLDGSSNRTRGDESDPVSVGDLQRRLTSLEVRASDLGRPRTGGLQRRRGELFGSLKRFAAWADCHVFGPRAAQDPNLRTAVAVQRHLAIIGSELGYFRWASDRYTSIIEPNDPSFERLVDVEDLARASGCLSRAAQREARDAGELSPKLQADFDQAIDWAKTAISHAGDWGSYTALGGALKRLATVSASNREELIRQAAVVYESRRSASKTVDLSPKPVYNDRIAIQLALIYDPTVHARALRQSAAPIRGVLKSSSSLVDACAAALSGYSEIADTADELLTTVLAFPSDEVVEPHLNAMIGAYETAFCVRSTWQERARSVDHLRDLCDLFPPGDHRRAAISEAVERLHCEEQPVDECEN